MPFIGMLIFFLVFFVALIVVMYRLLGRQAQSATEHLTDLGNDYLKKKEELKKETDDLHAKIQQMVAEAQKEADEIRKKGLIEAEDTKTQYMADAHAKAEKIIQEAIHARETLRAEMAQEMEIKAIEKACRLIETTLPHEIRWAAHIYWLNELIDHGFAQLAESKFAENPKEAKLVTAFPLSEDHKKVFLERLNAALGCEVALVESVNANLVAGVIVTLDHIAIDASLASKLNRVAQNVQNKYT